MVLYWTTLTAEQWEAMTAAQWESMEVAPLVVVRQPGGNQVVTPHVPVVRLDNETAMLLIVEVL